MSFIKPYPKRKQVILIRILICTGGYNSRQGNTIGMFQLDQAKALSSYGHDVRIASLDLRSARRIRSWKSAVYNLRGMKVYTVNFPCGGMPYKILNPASKLAAWKAFQMACSDGWKPDILHAHFTGIAYAFADVARESRIPFVVTEHNSAMNQEAVPNYLKRQAAYAYSRANELIAVSSALAKSIKKHTGFSATIVPNVLDADTFYVAREPHKDDAICFVTACNLIAGKRIHLLIQAFSNLKEEAKRLVIFGDGPERMKLENLAVRLGVEKEIVFCGKCPRSELQKAYKTADCFVLPSVSETFGVAYIEAMAAGLPVIATRCGGPEDFVMPEVGMLIPKDDVQALENSMEKMIKIVGNFDSEVIHSFVLKHFSPETIAQSLTIEYQQLYDLRVKP